MMNTENRALFEVWRNGKRIFHCEDKSCIPPKEIQKSMLKAGYSLFLSGRNIRSGEQA